MPVWGVFGVVQAPSQSCGAAWSARGDDLMVPMWWYQPSEVKGFLLKAIPKSDQTKTCAVRHFTIILKRSLQRLTDTLTSAAHSITAHLLLVVLPRLATLSTI